MMYATWDKLKVGAPVLLAALAVVAIALAVAGCAPTTIETPVGTFTSYKDSAWEGLEIQVIEELADGTKKKMLMKLAKATGTASTVVDAQAAALQSAIQAGIAIGRAAP